jgi:hypothetical protein
LLLPLGHCGIPENKSRLQEFDSRG